MQVISPLYSGGGQLYVPDTNIKASRELISQYTSALSQADTLIKQANDLKGDYDSFDEATKATLYTMLPTSINPVLLSDELTELIKTTNLETDGISQRVTVSSMYPDLGAYDLSFSVNGTYDDFKRVLRILQSSLRMYDIQAVSFTPAEKEGETTKMQISFKTYFLK